MAIFTFERAHFLGNVRYVDTRRVSVHVSSDEDLRKARVGQLVALSLPGAAEQWLIGLVDKVMKVPIVDDVPNGAAPSENDVPLPGESALNTVRVTLVGTVSPIAGNSPDLITEIPQY